MPPAAALYETLRADLLLGRACCREEMITLRFHGMWQGLAILLKGSPAALARSPPSPLNQPLRRDDEFIRLFANFVLQTHSELTHVC